MAKILSKSSFSPFKTFGGFSASKIIFDEKNENFLSSDEEIFVVLNPSEKNREKQCFLILSLFKHNLTGKLIFSQKEWESNLIACCFWCFHMLFLILSNYTFDALITLSKHPKWWNWKTWIEYSEVRMRPHNIIWFCVLKIYLTIETFFHKKGGRKSYIPWDSCWFIL